MHPHDPVPGVEEAVERVLLQARDVPLTRRDTLRVLGLIGLNSVLGGCMPATRSPALSGTSTGGVKAPDPLVIDVHTHIFNARDVSAADYFTDSIAHLRELNLAPAQVRFIHEFVEHVAKGIAGMAPSARTERDRLLEWERNGVGVFSDEALSRTTDDEQDMCAWRIKLRQIFNSFPTPEERQRVQNPSAALTDERNGTLGEPHDLLDLHVNPQQCGRATMRTYRPRFTDGTARFFAQVEALLFDDPGARSTAAARLFEGSEHAVTANRWLRRMARPRYEIAQELLRTYGHSDQSGGVDAFVVAMVDMQCWLGGSTDQLHDQVLLTSEIARMSGGRLLPFVAYDPLRDVRENCAALTLVQDAILQHGFVGVKMYPANGFRPMGNAFLEDDFVQPRCGTGSSRDLGKQLDDRLHHLYAWCEARGVPVMAHGNETKGTLRRYAERGNPTSWGRVAQQYPRLRINIGHFGGMQSLTARRRIIREVMGLAYMKLPDAPENWSIQILKLMADNDHIYSDVGAFSSILNRDKGISDFLRGKSGRVKRFTRNLGDLLGNDWYPEGRTRLMYGSDWYMVASTPGFADYRRRFEELYSGGLGREAAASFLGRNAAAFLGLRRGEPSRTRLDDFYRIHGVEGRWRTKVDALNP
jgi:predicted TIM-barrel fold metal-dependent hydrolase